MTVDPSDDRPLYKQLADLIRARINGNELPPGQRLPAEHDFAEEQGVSRDTVRQAIAILRNEGLIVTSKRGSHVKKRADLTAVHVAMGEIHARMPTEEERKKLGIHQGVPVLIVECEGRAEEIHPADRTFIKIDRG
jgi:DNA-binding GntR family transcriptional regulator